jgi:hypothetical protein
VPKIPELLGKRELAMTEAAVFEVDWYLKNVITTALYNDF